ncbi:MAG: hypothetical protein CL569_04935 [Alphaproteobacteria bacterium]|nr:hypothetical protein [Alphaproteobacteria bacterium]
MAEKKYFTTSNGTKIEINEELFDYLSSTMGQYFTPSKLNQFINSVSTNVSGGYENLDKQKTESLRENIDTVGLRGYASRYMLAQQFLDMLDTTATQPKFGKMLDIGCGYGIQPRVLKGLGIVDETVGIDLFDRCSAISAKNIEKLHRRFRLYRYIEPILDRINRKPRSEISDFERALFEKLSSPRYILKNFNGDLLPKEVYKARLVAEPSMNRFIEGNVYELDEKFDLITSFSSMEWFVLDDIFSKISDLLQPGGVFYMFVASWWASNSATRIIGHFPFSRQRLEKQDFHRYVDEFFPDEAEETKAAYDFYDPNHPTMADYVRAGIDHGLIPIATRGCKIPLPYEERFGISPMGYAEFDHVNFRKSLEEVQKFRPDVQAEDLLNTTIHFIFKKVDDGSRMDTKFYEEARKDISFKYRPKSAVMQQISRMAVKFFIR